MSQQVQGGRPLVRFRVLGFPVSIDLSFLIVIALIRYSSAATVRDIVVWLAIAPVAVLVHELGHALVARSTGAQPEIALVGLGGVTSFVPPGPLSRARGIAISMAGPAVGLVLGGLLLLLARSMQLVEGTLTEVLFTTAIFTTLGWSVLNLLPLLPLDGGQIMRELLPGAPVVRERRAALVSIVVGVAVAAFAVASHAVFAAVLMALFVASNVLTLRQPARVTGSGAEQQVAELVGQDRLPEARALAEREAIAHPEDPGAAALMVTLHAHVGDWDAVAADLRGPARAVVPTAVVFRVQEQAYARGAFAAGARICQAYGDRAGSMTAYLAYVAACGWAQAGDLPRALEALRAAVGLGFDDLRALDADPRLAALRGLPALAELTAPLRDRAPDGGRT